MAFNPQDHLTNLKGKDYLEVKWRLVWYREQCPDGSIETEMIALDLDREITKEDSQWDAEKRRSVKVQKTAKGYALFRATVTDGKGGKATGHGSESAVDFGDYIEKAETKAIGRALAHLGYGTQFTGDELDEGKRIVDSPVERNGEKPPETPSTETQGLATFNQIQAIANLCRQLGRQEPEGDITAEQAGKLISDLNKVKRERTQNGARKAS